MLRQEVESSSLKSLGYDPSTNTLEVEFNHGGVYQYFNVPKHIYDGLMSADSHGTYFANQVKKAGFDYQKIE